MKEIPLTKGKMTIVDDEDYEWLSQSKWHACFSRGKWYARTCTSDGKIVRMHRLIMNAVDGVEIDHKDGDGLHNWRSNLRECTRSQNMRNVRATSSSGYKGVSPIPYGRWRARIYLDGHEVRLGHFLSPEEAARAYDVKARELFGPFARTNFDN
jgi:hypothetical protein